MLEGAYWLRGFAHNELGKKEEATADFSKAQEVHAKSSEQKSSPQ